MSEVRYELALAMLPAQGSRGHGAPGSGAEELGGPVLGSSTPLRPEGRRDPAQGLKSLSSKARHRDCHMCVDACGPGGTEMRETDTGLWGCRSGAGLATRSAPAGRPRAAPCARGGGGRSGCARADHRSAFPPESSRRTP